jgi:ubiquinone/menaquinone biosynthesis C-methylase UbiE
MKRIPEPELMNDPAHVAVYAGNDLEDAYWLFEQCYRKFFPDFEPESTILDLGCGPAGIPIRLAQRFPECIIHGVDGAPVMLEQAQIAVTEKGLEQRIQLFCGTLPKRLNLPRSQYDVIISNSFLHHLAHPMVLWNEMLAYGDSNTAVLVIDLIRPDTEEKVSSIVAHYMADAPLLLQRDMECSLRAAFTLEEVSSQLEEAGLLQCLTVVQVSPFQFAVHGHLLSEEEKF